MGISLFLRVTNWALRGPGIAIALFLAIETIASSTSTIPTATQGMRFGMEIELTAQRLAPLMDYFDLGPDSDTYVQIIPTDWRPTFFDDYLEAKPSNLQTLPKELRDQLTAGLDLTTPQLERPPAPIIHRPPMPATARSGLLGPDGRPLGERSQANALLQLPATPALTPPPTIPSVRPSGIIRPESSAWQEVVRRWQELPFETKRAASKWEHLSQIKRAELSIAYSSQLQVRPSAPPEIRDYFARLHWSVDGNAIEFRHREDLKIHSWQELWDDIMQLGKLTGTDSFLRDPSSTNIRGLSLHYHVSRVGSNFEERAKALNVLLLLRRLEQGVMADISQTSPYRFDSNVRYRSLVRLHKSNRLEFRMRDWSLAEEFQMAQKALGSTAQVGLASIKSEIERIASSSPEVLLRLSQANEEIQSTVEKYLSPNLTAQLARNRQTIPERLWEIYHSGPSGPKRALRLLQQSDAVPENMVPILASMLSDAQVQRPLHLEIVIDLLEHKKRIPLSLWNELARFIDGSFAKGDQTRRADFALQVERIYGAGFTRSAPDNIRNFLASELMKRPNFKLTNLLDLGAGQKTWPSAIMDVLLAADKEDRELNRYRIQNHLLEIIRAADSLENPHPFLFEVAQKLAHSTASQADLKWPALWNFVRNQREIPVGLVKALAESPEEFRPAEYETLMSRFRGAPSTETPAISCAAKFGRL
jgi:hypothetical protein